jgi:membrane fusion protein (multidrug efflux system)
MRRSDAGQNSMVVPEKALIQVQGTYSVAVVGPDDHVQIRRVEVGPTTGTLRVVLSGVQVGERVVVDGTQKVSEGALVAPQPSGDGPAASAARP